MSETPDTTNRRLFFGGLPNSVTTHQLADAVVDFPKVSIALFKPTGGTRGGTFAFVTFESEAEAERAMETLSDLKIGEKAISIEKSDPSRRRQKEEKPAPKAEASAPAESAAAAEAKPRAARRKLPVSEDTVYIANIPLEVTEEDIAELFKAHDKPSITVVTKEPRRRRVGARVLTLAAKSYAFVKLGPGAQDKVIEELNGKEWRGSELKVSKATVSPEEVEEE